MVLVSGPWVLLGRHCGLSLCQAATGCHSAVRRLLRSGICQQHRGRQVCDGGRHLAEPAHGGAARQGRQRQHGFHAAVAGKPAAGHRLRRASCCCLPRGAWCCQPRPCLPDHGCVFASCVHTCCFKIFWPTCKSARAPAALKLPPTVSTAPADQGSAGGGRPAAAAGRRSATPGGRRARRPGRRRAGRAACGRRAHAGRALHRPELAGAGRQRVPGLHLSP